MSVRPIDMSTKSSQEVLKVTLGASARPWTARVLPLATTTCQSGAPSVNSHWSTPGPLAAEVFSDEAITSNSIAMSAGSLDGGPTFSPSRPARTMAWPRAARSRGVPSTGNTGGPGSSSMGMPAERSLVSSDDAPSSPMSSRVNPKDSM